MVLLYLLERKNYWRLCKKVSRLGQLGRWVVT